jgi:lipopolysaccharide/colanic/teichoic acid biosynthesis glycosyltransferase
VRQFSQLVPHYMERHAVQVGITGWAQVKGLRGGGTPIEERTRYDLAYAGSWSLWLDLKIILLTVRQVLSGENAY